MSESGESYFDGNQYMKRLADREKAIPRDSPLLIQPMRPEPPAECSKPSQGSSKTGWTRPSENPEEYQRLKKMYYEHAALPATRLVSSFVEGEVTEVVEGKAWVVPGVLSPEECATIIAKGEEAGMTYGKGEESNRVRTSKRTNDYMAPWMTEMITPRLCEDLLQKIEGSAPQTAVRGIHTNWRVAVYYPGNAFPAHYDLSDTVRVEAEEEGKIEVCTSSHTLLIYLSPPDSFNGGATRLFLSGKYDQDTLDVRLPQGAALIFQQKGMLHAGLEVLPGLNSPDGHGEKYIAQAGVLRGQSKMRFAPSLFKFGPGLDPS